MLKKRKRQIYSFLDLFPNNDRLEDCIKFCINIKFLAGRGDERRKKIYFPRFSKKLFTKFQANLFEPNLIILNSFEYQTKFGRRFRVFFAATTWE